MGVSGMSDSACSRAISTLVVICGTGETQDVHWVLLQ
jgi:hypothetical protein